MQLLLRSRPFRIDRQSDGFPRQHPVKTLLDQGLGAPRDGEDGRRVGGEHLRVFDAGDAPGRNGEHLGDADQILQNRHALLDAAIEVDAFAGLRTQTRFHVRHALAMHDPPQSVRIGAGWRGECRHASGDGEIEDDEHSSPGTFARPLSCPPPRRRCANRPPQAASVPVSKAKCGSPASPPPSPPP